MTEIKFDDLLRTGAHFGHVTSKWNPYYEPFVLMVRNGVHIINLEETIKNLNNAIQFLQDTVRDKGEILFVGTKKQAKDTVQEEADRCSMFYVVERWLGGTLTNFSTIRKSIKRLQLLEKEGSSIYENLTKKEIQMLNRERIKLSDQHRGIKDMRRLPEAVVVVDANHEATVIKETNRLEIPVVAIVDSNTDPRPVDYPIPANDDSIRTIKLIISAIADGIIAARDGSDSLEESIAGMNEAGKDDESDAVESEDNSEKESLSVESGESESVEESETDNQETEESDTDSTESEEISVTDSESTDTIEEVPESSDESEDEDVEDELTEKESMENKD
ncbi:MAG: 30S ribosomal protein S2 [Candidatus Neomarinimicrobiota bacterium]|nr:30S ribosomal protein S2 [Candidatus Neomarinimicrobiota bacterium]